MVKAVPVDNSVHECPMHGKTLDRNGQCTVYGMFSECYYQWDERFAHQLVITIDSDTLEIEHEVKHPPVCQSTTDFILAGIPHTYYECGIDSLVADEVWADGDSGYYDRPGLYRIEIWGGKSWTDYGWEHDGRVYLLPLELQIGTIPWTTDNEVTRNDR